MLQHTSVAMRVMLMGSKCLRVDMTGYLPLCTMCLSHDTMFKPCLRSVKCDLKALDFAAGCSHDAPLEGLLHE